jgi:hypothetical protein
VVIQSAVPLPHSLAQMTSGFALFGVTMSYIVLAVILFLPPYVVSLLWLHSLWVKNDFDWMLPGGIPRDIRALCGPGTVDGTSPANASEADKTTGNRKRNLLVVVLMAVSVGCLVAFALVSSIGFESAWVGWVIAGGVFIFVTTVFAALEVGYASRPECFGQAVSSLVLCAPPFVVVQYVVGVPLAAVHVSNLHSGPYWNARRPHHWIRSTRRLQTAIGCRVLIVLVSVACVGWSGMERR